MHSRCCVLVSVTLYAVESTEKVRKLDVYKLAVGHGGMHAEVHGILVLDLGGHEGVLHLHIVACVMWVSRQGLE